MTTDEDEAFRQTCLRELRDGTMPPHEFASWNDRLVPQWFNLDKIITGEEVAELEEIRVELREFVVKLIPLAKRVRWVFMLSERIPGEHGWELFEEVLDTNEVDDLALIVGFLLAPESAGITDEHVPVVVKKYGDRVPGLESAVEEIQAEHDAYHPKKNDKEVAQ